MTTETKTALAGAAVETAEGQALTANGTPGNGGQALDVRALMQRPLVDLSNDELAAVAAEEKRMIREHATAGKAAGSPTNEPQLLVENMRNITPEPLRWLWAGVIPLGKLTMLVGDPGLGKSLMTLDMAARVSRGVPWPDGTQNQIGEVVLLSAEDDPADTIRPRLDAAQALPAMIHYVRAVREGKKTRSFNLEADVARLDARRRP